jgi:hypothetical protein
MAAPVTSEKIILSFGWKGPSSWHGGRSHGGLDVGVVDLVFKNAKTDISVPIPDNISPPTVQKFPFTCRRYHEAEWELNGRRFKPLAQETHPDLLNVSVEQIRNLTVKAGIFKESPHQGPAIMDSSGKIMREKRALRSDREIKLEVPEELEIGQTYTLVITSHGAALIEARLIKEEKPAVTSSSAKEDDTQLIKDQTELFELLGDVLLPIMGMKVMEFRIKLISAPSGNKITLDSNFVAQTLGIEAIKSEIRKIESCTLKELMIKMRASRAVWEHKPLERNALEKEAFRSCFNAIGAEGLVNIMRSSLESLVQASIPSDVKHLINGIADRFKEICINHVNT